MTEPTLEPDDDASEKYEISSSVLDKIKRHRRAMVIDAFLRKSRLYWVLDPFPYETHNAQPRSIVQTYRRLQLRHRFSWHSIARLQNENAFRAGLFGLVTAPILAGLSLKAPFFISVPFPIQMAFIFLSGLLFVLATVFFRWSCPDFVADQLGEKSDQKYRALPEHVLRSAIDLEFLKLARVIEINNEKVAELSRIGMQDETAQYMLNADIRCFIVGFDFSALAMIERLIYKIAEVHNFRIFEEWRAGDNEMRIGSRMGPGVTYGLGDLDVHHIGIEKVTEHFLSQVDPSRISGSPGPDDLILKRFQAHVCTADGLADDNLIEPFTSGLNRLTRTEYLPLIIEELASWQSWQRPLSRLTTALMYSASLLCFALFLAFQNWVVWDAISF